MPDEQEKRQRLHKVTSASTISELPSFSAQAYSIEENMTPHTQQYVSKILSDVMLLKKMVSSLKLGGS